MMKLSTKAEFAEAMRNILAVEIQARKGYEQDIHTFKNFKIVNAVKEVKKDEDKHIALLESIIKMLEK